MRRIMTKVSKIIQKTMASPDKAVNHFLVNLIQDLNNLSSLAPRELVAKVVNLKSKSLTYRLEDAERFIDNFNAILSEKTEEWETIATQWMSPKSLDLYDLLVEESKKFQIELKRAFNVFQDISESHNRNLLFILENYDNLTAKDISNLEKMRKRLGNISKMTYANFISNLKKGSFAQH